MHTPRGRHMVQYIISDLRDMMYDRPIKYLAVYSKDVITADEV